MATFPLTKSNCDYPGTGSNDYGFYGMHPFEHLRVYRPVGWDTTGFKNARCIVDIHGGLGHNPVNAGMIISGGGYHETLYSTHGWVVVSIDYPPVFKNSDPYREPGCCRPFPAHVFSVARALSLIRTNAGPIGGQTAQLAADLWGVDGNGDVNTINPDIVISGFSYGGTLALLMGLIPPSVMGIQNDMALGLTPFEYAMPHTPRAVVHYQAQIDWTQFAFNPSISSGTYRDNRHQVFTPYEDGALWGDQYGGSPGSVSSPSDRIPEHWKRSASPWWWAVQAFPEIRQTAFLGLGQKAQSSDPDQQNLTKDDWSPGVPHIEEDLGKAWYDPHLNFQVEPLHALFDSLDIPNDRAWGNSTTNPEGNNLDVVGVNTFTVDYLINVLGL